MIDLSFKPHLFNKCFSVYFNRSPNENEILPTEIEKNDLIITEHKKKISELEKENDRIRIECAKKENSE
jgi:hypothetical protein